VARVHQKIANKRADFCHKLTTNLVQDHDALCIENLSVKGLARTKLAMSVMDASMGIIRRQLEYKGVWYRTHVIAVGRFYPSSKLCHECGHKNDELTCMGVPVVRVGPGPRPERRAQHQTRRGQDTGRGGGARRHAKRLWTVRQTPDGSGAG